MGAENCICTKSLNTRFMKKKHSSDNREKIKMSYNETFYTSEEKKNQSTRLSGCLDQRMTVTSDQPDGIHQKYPNGEERYYLYEIYQNETNSWSDATHFVNKETQKLFSININEEPIKKFYSIGLTIGSGNYANVKRGYSLANPSIKVAIKIYDLDCTPERQLAIFREISIMSTLDHPGLTKMYEVYKDSTKLYIVSELAQGVQLYDYIFENKKILEKDTKMIIKQLLSITGYIHSKNIVHRDLKPDNIIIDPCTLKIKVLDFGSSSYFLDSKDLTEQVGTPFYVSPELLKGKYNYQADIWSIGIIAYLMLTGCPPFQDEDTQEIYMKILNQPLPFCREQWIYLSQDSMKFVAKLLIKNPAKRIAISEALLHPWLKDLEENSLSFTETMCKKLLNRNKLSVLAREILHIYSDHIDSQTLSEWNKVFDNIYSPKYGLADMEKLKKILNKSEEFKKLSRDPDYMTLAITFNNFDERYIPYTEFLAGVIDLHTDIPHFNLTQILSHMGINNEDETTNEALQKYLQRRGYQNSKTLSTNFKIEILSVLKNHKEDSSIPLRMLSSDTLCEDSGTCVDEINSPGPLFNLIHN
ncbi:unnamed protein product [Moneuplotes crassus]|uniref:Protein kinase domain-containing protein n=1 Tax=Euplotes crassus TaxID=5936 RepID=A0AAD1Y6X3_EUPCR|nr:unnamed protein product [Moneuplotes crassus]